MSTNPFESPQDAPVLKSGRKPRGVFFTIMALVFWLLAVGMAFISVDVLSREENIPRRLFNPVFFWFFALMTLGLPTCSLGLFGIGCWRRSKSFAFAGFGAIALLLLFVLAIFLIGLLRRSMA